ncbi:MAG: PSD1 and planctomycete cytochrome C domain-containing protein [Fuerstiella sp.]|nr:PSD1 and planctomycete cytochrome C domain-containing protein [Fuerstiella sp.]
MPSISSRISRVFNHLCRACATLALLGICENVTAADEAAELTPEQRVFVTAKVIPLLESRCFECHKGPKKPKGGLLLTGRKSLLRGGESGPAIVPGKPEESLLIEAIRYEGFEMPPRTRMPQAEVDILVKWIADGAPWPEELDAHTEAISEDEFPLEQRRQSHWAWQPIGDPQPPSVNIPDWCAVPVDAFVLARLERIGLQPAAHADRRTLIRRLYFDIIGLPPSVEQVETFVADPGTDDEALTTVVDGLLRSPHFGERWGRHWLDLVRYAETLGHEFDFPLHNAWRYRDYVIRALNADVPYDQFVREHVAGDLLSQPRRHPIEKYNESIIGTGFWFLAEDKHAPVDVRGEEAGKVDNQIDVFSRAFLGLTVACARCHDHKFDAISTKDYYALAGFLQSSRRHTGLLDPDQKIRQRVDKLLTSAAAAEHELEQIDATYDAAEFQKYASAAVEAIKGQPTAAVTEVPAPILFEDFEDESFGKWKANGAAFADGTSDASFAGQSLSGFQGKRLANSWLRSDGLQGDLISSDFKIEQPHISFLIGGGNHKDKTCMNLVVDDKTVRTATGKNSDAMFLHSWDVTEFVGKSARLEIIDHHQGGWGHIDIDHIVFSQLSETGPRRNIAVVAKERHCDPRTLARWVKALLKTDNAAVTMPLSLPARMAQSENDPPETVRQWRNEVTSASRTKTSDTTLFADLRQGIPSGWFASGPAFAGDSADTERLCSWHSDGLHYSRGTGAISSSLSTELRGTLSSPTFELQHPEILVCVAGEGCRLRLVIDGYVMNEFSELLFAGAKQKIDTGGRFQWIRLAADVQRYQGHRVHLEFLDEGDGWFSVQEIRFANRAAAAPPKDAPHTLNNAIIAADNFNKAGAGNDLEHILGSWSVAMSSNVTATRAIVINNDLAASSSGWQAIEDGWEKLAKGIPAPMQVIAMTDGTPENERVFIRGSHLNLGDVAERRILTALHSADAEQSFTGSGRRELADQLIADDNPLLARVAVNRIWHHLFGAGIVESTDNFGVLGKKPTHPLLLDYLASQFRHNGWSTKQMIRTLVLSRTYRLSSQRSVDGDRLDPTDRLLHRARIRRLQGEAVRDAMLTVSGRLDRTLFGSPVPVHLTAFMQGRGRPGTNGPVDGNARRSIYSAVNRNFLSPFMLAFDVPAPVTTTGKRVTSNVPAQALIMLNNEFVNQQARLWAVRLLAEQLPTPEDVLGAAWHQLFGRPATSEELAPLLEFSGAADQNGGLDVNTLTEVCHVLLNSKEFIFLH